MAEHPFTNDSTPAERREVLENDKRQGSTFSQFAESEASEPRGRFTANEKSNVIGSTPVPNYPAAFQQRDSVPNERPLGFSIEDHEPVGTAKEIQASLEKLAESDDDPPEAAR